MTMIESGTTHHEPHQTERTPSQVFVARLDAALNLGTEDGQLTPREMFPLSSLYGDMVTDHIRIAKHVKTAWQEEAYVPDEQQMLDGLVAWGVRTTNQLKETLGYTDENLIADGVFHLMSRIRGTVATGESRIRNQRSDRGIMRREFDIQRGARNRFGLPIKNDEKS